MFNRNDSGGLIFWMESPSLGQSDSAQQAKIKDCPSNLVLTSSQMHKNDFTNVKSLLQILILKQCNLQWRCVAWI